MRSADLHQFAQVALLLLELLFQGRLIEHHQQLALAHPIAHLHLQLADLPLGAAVEDGGAAGHDHHTAAHYFGGHWPEQGPERGEAAHADQAEQHLAFGVAGLVLHPAPEGLQ